MKKKTAVAVRSKRTVPMRVDGTLDFQSLIAMAIANDPPSVERLLAMKSQMKAEQAREAYFEALAGFQSECPIVFKGKKVRAKKKEGQTEGSVLYGYAPIEDILAFRASAGEPSVKELLKKWGFSYSFKSHQSEDGKRYTAICYAHHKDGHSDYTEFTVPTEFPDYMNLSGAQEQGASCTYADRYAFKNRFGIVTKGDDNDAPQEERQARVRPIQPPQERKADTVPVQHEEKKIPDKEKRSDYDEILFLLKSTSTDPKTNMIVQLFNANEVIDYTHEANEAKNDPDKLKLILKDVVDTGKKRHKAVKGEA